MIKKAISILLIVYLLFCLTACNTTETESNTSYETQSQIILNKDNSKPNEIQSEDTDVTSDIEVAEENNTSQTQTSKSQPKSTEITHKTTHTHSYSMATCTSPKKCSCGATIGTALGHQFSSATCTSPQICNRCGTTSGNALGHNYVNNKCSRCGKVNPESLPIELNNAYLIDSQHYQYKSGNFTDSFGNKYTNVHFYKDLYDSGNGREAYSIFNLNGQYAKFSGSIVAADNTYAKGTYYINIYVDNVLTYSKTGFTKTSGKIDFNINIKGAQQLSIRVGHEQTLTSYNEQIGIVNAQLSK